MYIAPNSTIKFLTNVPIDETYEHSLWFNSVSDQTTYFNSKALYTLTNQSYVRETDGLLRVSLTVEQLYNCNYIMFQNTSFSNKWFYGFITNIQYRANATSYVTFKIDVIQTWLFDFNVKPSFIEREHSATDIAGENLVPENLETGEYIIDGDVQMLLTSYGAEPIIVVCANFIWDNENQQFYKFYGLCYNGIFSGAALNGFYDVSDAIQFIDDATRANLANGIISVFMMYDTFWYEGDYSMIPQTNQNVISINQDLVRPTKAQGIDNYFPVKNNKLLTYPYCFLYVSDNQGTGVAMPYEYFKDPYDIDFLAEGNCTPDPAVIIYPRNYKTGNSIGAKISTDEKMVLKGFPMCAWTTDTYKAWIAQNGSALAVSNLSAAVTGIAGAYAGDVGSVTASGQTIINNMMQVHQHKIMPFQSHGNVSGNALYSAELLDFSVCRKCITPEFAAIIDDYFSKFGYATNRVKVPNLWLGLGRPHYNYVKTNKAMLDGNVPADDMRTLQDILDAGITFWNYPSEVGNYESIDNSPISEENP